MAITRAMTPIHTLPRLSETLYTAYANAKNHNNIHTATELFLLISITSVSCRSLARPVREIRESLGAVNDLRHLKAVIAQAVLTHSLSHRLSRRRACLCEFLIYDDNSGTVRCQ